MSLAHRLTPANLLWMLPRLLSLPVDDLPAEESQITVGPKDLDGRRYSRDRDKAAVRHHYDVSNEFYRLWLDTRMVYTCAYFPTGTEDLDAAQQAKLELICRKLRLAPGERFLDIGCGWGGLAIHAAKHFGVRATGITLSHAQATEASRRIEIAGLSDRIRIITVDYRDFVPKRPFDKVSSIEMYEQVGRSELPTYFRKVHALTRPGGLFLNQGIVDSGWTEYIGNLNWAVRPFFRPGAFLDRYVFPDGELATNSALIQHAEGSGFEARDVESLREHYVPTLRHWVRRLEAHHGKIVQLVGERTFRVWRAYMAGCAEQFNSGRNGLVQMLFARPTPGGRCELPPTRSDIYRP
jgi:cyclopropane-fatty-acyl-phospholipid synthase